MSQRTAIRILPSHCGGVVINTQHIFENPCRLDAHFIILPQNYRTVQAKLGRPSSLWPFTVSVSIAVTVLHT